MPQETIVYIVNLIIGVILAALMTHQWRQAGRVLNMRCWMMAAWVMTGADALFALRPELPNWIGRLFPTILITVGHGVLLFGAQRTGGQRVRHHVVVAILAVHAGLLIGFLLVSGFSQWRMVCNGVIWGGLSLASFAALRSSPAPFHQSLLSPANVFLIHAAFHGLRIILATFFAAQGPKGGPALLQVVGDFEASFFMVALFVSLLISHLQQRHEELSRALAEVKVLSGLLPVCAWCRKVRDDDGYWKQMEEYFSSHSQVRFTHGICQECRTLHFVPDPAVAKTPEAPEAPTCRPA